MPFCWITGTFGPVNLSLEKAPLSAANDSANFFDRKNFTACGDCADFAHRAGVPSPPSCAQAAETARGVMPTVPYCRRSELPDDAASIPQA